MEYSTLFLMCLFVNFFVKRSWNLKCIGVRDNFSGGAESFLPEIFFLDSAPKNCYANLQNYFARLTTPNY